MTRFGLLIVLLISFFAANLFFGAIHIPAPEVVDAFLNRSENEALRFIVVNNRLPQAITAMLGGAALAVTGLLLQTAFHNPLAGPSILGISSGASLGVALVILFLGGSLSVGSLSWGGNAAIVVGALVGSLGIMGMLIALSNIVKNNLMLLITGIMAGYLTSSIVTLLSSVSTAQGVQNYVMWGMGTFGDVSTERLPWFSLFTVLGLLMSLLLAKPLNILLLGDNYAANLGVNVKTVRNLLLLATGVLTAIVTAYCGPVAFVGLAVPHISRMIFKTDNHWVLIPAAMLIGAILCLGCNVASTTPENTVIPINALTPVVGVPVILYVILRARR
ncbi:MAG: iron ABC transporter permease [Muribaculaceae bacterium]|nr:iron ABC transporter permease [Muribaculaceae bacterium]